MKLFIISDIHGSLIAFEKALNQFEKENADYLVICGDFLNHGPRNNIPEGYDTKKLAEKLNSYKEKIIGIRGNCFIVIYVLVISLVYTFRRLNIPYSKALQEFCLCTPY